MKNLRLHVMRLRLTQQTHILYFRMINNRITNEVKTSKICLLSFVFSKNKSSQEEHFLFYFFIFYYYYFLVQAVVVAEKKKILIYITSIDIEQITFFLDRANNHHQKEDLKRE